MTRGFARAYNDSIGWTATRRAPPCSIEAAYTSGMRFDGDIDIPVIDWRHYLEEQLDMHHSHQSFATRSRMQEHGREGNQVIWLTDARPTPFFDQTAEAFEVIDEWMANLRTNPELGVEGNKPARATDRCFDLFGNEIAAGDDVQVRPAERERRHRLRRLWRLDTRYHRARAPGADLPGGRLRLESAGSGAPAS